jgi:hypothetical protein
MKKTRLLGVVLSGALAAAPAMAENSGADFHALSQLSTGLTSMSEGQLASIEGGDRCGSYTGNAGGDGAILGISVLPISVLNCSPVQLIVQANVGILNSGEQTNVVKEARQRQF